MDPKENPHSDLASELEEALNRLAELEAERVAAAHRSAQEQELNAAILHSSGALVVVIDPEGRVARFNWACEMLSGFTEDEVRGKLAWELFLADEEREEARKLISGLLEGGHSQRLANHWIGQDGRPRLIDWTHQVMRTDEGDVKCVIATGFDLTGRRNTEDLEEYHRRVERLLNSISSILIGVDESDCITQWNRVAEKTFGLEATAVIGRPFTSTGISWNWLEVLEQIERCVGREGPTNLNDIHYQCVGGESGVLGLTVSPMRHSNGSPAGYVILGTDITERKRLEEHLAQAQRLESIGQLAAGIAHEINTPIQFVGDNTRFLQDAMNDIGRLLEKYRALFNGARAGSIPEGILGEIEKLESEVDLPFLIDEIPQSVQQSLDGVSRVAKIVRAMKDFSHPGSEDKAAVDINRAIESTLTVARNEWKYVAELTLDLEEDLPLVPCHPGDLNQVILNLVVNASHAIEAVVGDGAEEKGRITVSTRRDGDWVEIRVQDSGEGIPTDVQPRLFEPFFTTKEVGRGTGQGLAICHAAIVKGHGGTITFDTTPGQGTIFIVRLPISDETLEESA
jgi:PAS domain S-box-containing protein